ncbi:hypothetical protein [Bacillus norwichensis]|uniref:Variable outer membrane protein n=1 Tax=Bacillus norwichensis TaxID=2762217 RepID=A0ABR8VRR6_9BACI|nr:hypothetical protein [Bacillus norwichensis]MBD8007437.1 hypothetical protein [Bacillus norwichensis]
MLDICLFLKINLSVEKGKDEEGNLFVDAVKKDAKENVSVNSSADVEGVDADMKILNGK